MDNHSLSDQHKHISDLLTHVFQHLVPLTQQLQELTHLLSECYKSLLVKPCTTGLSVDASVGIHSQEHLYEEADDSPDDMDDDHEAYLDPDDTEEDYDNDDVDGEEDINEDYENNTIGDTEDCYVYRRYAIPRFIIEEEQSLLKRYKLDRLQDLFDKVYEEFYIIATLMKYFNSSVFVEDVNEEALIQMIGRQLLQFLDGFGSVCSVFADFDETALYT